MHRYPLAARLGAALLLFTAACHSNSTGPKSGPTTFSGRATALQANVMATGTDTALVTVGPLASTGGALDAAMASALVTGIVTADGLHSTAIGQGAASTSSASLSDLSLTLGGHTITADFVQANASATCSGGAATVAGSAVITNLVVDGAPVTASGAVDQSVPLSGGGTLVINEQTSTSNSITVNALHVTIAGVGDIIVATAMASITCGTECPSPSSDFVTGGGWINVGGAKGTFAVSGGLDGTTPWGSLEFHDHGTGLTVHGTGVSGYTVVNATTRSITGNATIGGVAGTYTAVVSDKGEPSTNDTFDLTLSTGYSASGALGGGNIQLHVKPSCP